MKIAGTVYGGSGRLTGQHWPVTEQDIEELYHSGRWHEIAIFDCQSAFDAAFIEGEHYQCHSPNRPGWDCPHCEAAGWNR
jgi:hypothetical protein